MAQYVVETVTVQKRERLVTINWLNADPKEIAKVGGERRERFKKDADARLKRAMGVHTDTKKFIADARRAVLDATLLDDDWMLGATGQDPLRFFYLLACIEDDMRKSQEAPLVRNGVDPERASQRGNRCILDTEHMLQMVLQHMWTGCAQDALQGAFGVDQSTVSRNIALMRGTLARSQNVPTDKVITKEIADLPKDKAIKATGGAINADFTHIEIEAPQDQDSNDEAYSGKAHTTTCNTMFECLDNGLIIGRSCPVGGRTSEIEILRREAPDLGHVTESLKNPDTPEGKRIEVRVDKGPRGIRGEWPGADVSMPHFKPRGGELTDEQRRENYEMNSKRAIIENCFADIKDYRIVKNVYRGSVDELDETLTVLTGLTNLAKVMRRLPGWKPKRHRHGPKRGRKKAGPKGRKPRLTFKKQK